MLVLESKFKPESAIDICSLGSMHSLNSVSWPLTRTNLAETY
jgi:hypothetical protein